MSDKLKITKDKRYRSSSSLVGTSLEGTYSERKLNIRGSHSLIASIPEVEDQFAVAESRCDELREKLDFVKALKKQKRRLRRRSTTKIGSLEETRAPHPPPPPPLHPPQDAPPRPPRDPTQLIAVHAQPKRKALPTQSQTRGPLNSFRNPTRAYVDPDTTEQHRMLGQVRQFDETYTQEYLKMLQNLPQDVGISLSKDAMERIRRKKLRNNRADGDISVQQRLRRTDPTQERDLGGVPSDQTRPEKARKKRQFGPAAGNQWRYYQEEEDEEVVTGNPRVRRGGGGVGSGGRHQPSTSNYAHQPQLVVKEERPVVELFNKNNTVPLRSRRQNGAANRPPPPGDLDERADRLSERDNNIYKDAAEAKHLRNMKKLLLDRVSKSTFNNDDITNKPPSKVVNRLRKLRGRHRSRGYELPTVASQMKQKGMRCNYGMSNFTSIPFVVSKSTAPSHNIGVNIQQVLNGMKIQQPISGIPLTIAHHMGLRHSPTWGLTRSAKSAPEETSLETRDINLIKLGRRLLRLPSYKYMSYNRLLSLYREGEGMVPRFLRAMSRPNYFYNSMFNLSARGDGSVVSPSSKRRSSGQDVKQSLTEYANLYKEYESLNKQLKNNSGVADWEVERRLEELSRELAAREEHLRRAVSVFKGDPPAMSGLKASASTIGGIERITSAYKLNAASDM